MLVSSFGRFNDGIARFYPMADLGPTSASSHIRFQTGTDPRRVGCAESGALGLSRDVNGKIGAVGQGLHPGFALDSPTGRHDSLCRNVSQVKVMAYNEPGGFVGGRGYLRGPVVQTYPEQLCSALRVVPGGALTSQIRHPYREIPGTRVEHFGLVDGADHRAHTVDEETACVAGTANRDHPINGIRDGPQPLDFAPLVGETPNDQRRATDHQHVAAGVSIGHGLPPPTHQLSPLR